MTTVDILSYKLLVKSLLTKGFSKRFFDPINKSNTGIIELLSLNLLQRHRVNRIYLYFSINKMKKKTLVEKVHSNCISYGEVCVLVYLFTL